MLGTAAGRLSPDSRRSRRWTLSSQIQSQSNEPPSTAGTRAETVENETRSYRAYLERVRESPPYWFLLDQIFLHGFNAKLRPSPYQLANPIYILEVAADGSSREFKHKTTDDLRAHLKKPFVRGGYGLTDTSSRGRRVVLVTEMTASALEVLGDIYGMDLGFFADHLLPDEHVSYTSKTTRSNHLHVLEENKPPSKRFQLEYRELSRFSRSHWSPRNVCQVFDKGNSQFNWDAIFQRRFSMFTHIPTDGLATDIYLFDEHAFRGPFALGVSRFDLPSFIDFRGGDDEVFDRSLGIYREQDNVRDVMDQGRPFQDALVHFFKDPDFDPIRAFESSSYILTYILKLTLVMWRHLLVKVEHSFLNTMENRITSDDVHDLLGGSLSSVSAELSKCAHLVARKTIPTIRALCREHAGEDYLAGVLEDYTILCEDIIHVAARAEKAHAIVLSKLSITESKKAIEHSIQGIELARSVGRLTKLAFIFIPLSFVASFLGMNGMELDGFSDQTKRVIWVFFTLSIPLVTITIFFAVPERISSVVKRCIYLIRRRFGIGWVHETGVIEKYYVQKRDVWEEYHRWLCSLGWERRENVHARALVVVGDSDNQRTQMRVGLVLGTWLHLRHAWGNVN